MAPKYASLIPPFGWTSSLSFSFSFLFCGALQRSRFRNNTVIRGEKAAFTGLGRLIVLGTPLTVPQTTTTTWWQARIPLHEIIVSNRQFSLHCRDVMWSSYYALQIDRLTSTLFELDREQEVAIKLVLSTRMGLCPWSLFSFLGLWRHISCREQLCPTIYRRKRYRRSECWAWDRKVAW